MRALHALLLVIAVCSCTAPPPAKSDQEKRRPPRSNETLDALVIDREGNSTWLINLALRNAAPLFEDDNWYFFEIDVEGQDDPVVKTFNELRRIYVGEVKGKRLAVTLVPRQGQDVTGTLRRRASLEGLTEFGPMTIHLRDVRQISFGGSRPKTKAEATFDKSKSRNR